MKKLNILWCSDNIVTVEKMLLMYAVNAMMQNWWDEVVVIIWGASARLVAENAVIKQRIEIAQLAGVKFEACKACADQLGVSEKLSDMGINVYGYGDRLTEILQDGENLLSI